MPTGIPGCYGAAALEVPEGNPGAGVTHDDAATVRP